MALGHKFAGLPVPTTQRRRRAGGNRLLHRWFVLATCVLCTGSSFALAASPVRASDPCGHYLFNGDNYLGEMDCPNLPGIDETGLVRSMLPDGARKARVREIIDGDTIRVSIGHEYFVVRIIGVDTPEDVDPNTPEECFGVGAAAYTAALIPVGTLLYLDADVSDVDRYDRKLRSVWFEQGEGRYRLLQDALARDGYAVLSTYPPDIEYVDFLVEAQSDARENGRGLWTACDGADTPLNGPAPSQVVDENAGFGLAAQTGCDPAYPDVCIPPVSQVGDLDCGDIAFTWFTVLPPDPHNFDAEGDGYGCER